MDCGPELFMGVFRAFCNKGRTRRVFLMKSVRVWQPVPVFYIPK